MTANTAHFFDLDAAPISVAHVTLLVQDLDRMARFYVDLLGLTVFCETQSEVVLGRDAPFLTLRAPGGLLQSPQNRPGLFHTAFLLPSRNALGAWFHHAIAAGHAPLGSDHGVSEALYLSDPEGNGIEVYADRPVERWHDSAGRVVMGTQRLNMRALPKAPWSGAPAGTRIGHVHLQTPDLTAASAFWMGQGFDLMAQYPGALFWGSGGYHHQLATNIWSSRDQPPRHNGLTGLSNVTLFAPVAVPKTLTDPSGVEITVTPKQD